MDDPKKQAAQLALTVIQRFVGTQEDALAKMRDQVAQELAFAESNAARLRAELEAIDELVFLTADSHDAPDPPLRGLFTPPPLRKAIIIVFESRRGYWGRDELLQELTRRNWAPGGKNPRNTLISRLSELEREGKIEKMGDGFGLPEKEEVSAV